MFYYVQECYLWKVFVAALKGDQISFHFINQKPMIPRTDFYYKTTRVEHS